jgi:hypothetical protein
MGSDPPVPTWHLPKAYNDSKFWIRGNKATKGARNPQVIYLGVGHALSNWERVESAAAMFFSEFVESRSVAGIRAYGTINGSRGREAALRQAAETFFSLRKVGHQKERATHDIIAKTEKVVNRLIHNYGQASARRTDIAHGIAEELSRDKAPEMSWFLVAPNYRSPKTANWIADDVGLRQAKGLRLSDPDAYFDYNKFYYKNSEYVFGPAELKILAGKFAYLYADMLCFLNLVNPCKFELTSDSLYPLAKSLALTVD